MAIQGYNSISAGAAHQNLPTTFPPPSSYSFELLPQCRVQEMVQRPRCSRSASTTCNLPGTTSPLRIAFRLWLVGNCSMCLQRNQNRLPRFGRKDRGEAFDRRVARSSSVEGGWHRGSNTGERADSDWLPRRQSPE